MPDPPIDRGRFLSVEDVNRIYFGGRKRRYWITHRFAPHLKIRQGREVYWWELDANEWLDSLRKVGRRKRAG